VKTLVTTLERLMLTSVCQEAVGVSIDLVGDYSALIDSISDVKFRHRSDHVHDACLDLQSVRFTSIQYQSMSRAVRCSEYSLFSNSTTGRVS
jgi:hypothetical protein